MFTIISKVARLRVFFRLGVAKPKSKPTAATAHCNLEKLAPFCLERFCDG